VAAATSEAAGAVVVCEDGEDLSKQVVAYCEGQEAGELHSWSRLELYMKDAITGGRKAREAATGHAKDAAIALQASCNGRHWYPGRHIGHAKLKTGGSCWAAIHQAAASRGPRDASLQFGQHCGVSDLIMKGDQELLSDVQHVEGGHGRRGGGQVAKEQLEAVLLAVGGMDSFDINQKGQLAAKVIW